MLAVALALLVVAQSPEILAGVTVQGNVATPDAEIIRLAGVQVGAPLEPDAVDEVAARLRATKRFERIEVRKRFASIADPTQIVLVIVVDEGPVSVQYTGDPDHPTRVVRRRRLNLMFAPILGAEDGYGVTYGARLTRPDPLGPHSRVMFPLSWGGMKRAGVEVDKEFTGKLVTHAEAGAAVSRRTHPFFQQDEDRDRFWVRGEHLFAGAVRVGATAGWQHVSFLGASDRFVHAAADVTVDTRSDPMLARNAIFARAAIEHLQFDNGRGGTNRLEVDARGYVGLAGQAVLVVRGLRADADRPLPAYLQSILGGIQNLRGFAAGTAVGDTLVGGSAELRMPLTSPLSIGKIGVSVFADAATVYDKGSRLADQDFKRGVGASLWFSAAFLRIEFAVAHGIGSTTRAHFGGGTTF